MSTVELAGWILALEFALIAGVVFFLMRRQQWAATKSERAKAPPPTAAPASRRQQLMQLFEQALQLSGDKLNQRVDGYLSREQAFYTAMTALYLNREGLAFQDLPPELATTLIPWSDLAPDVATDHTVTTLSQLLDDYRGEFAAAPAPQPLASDEDDEQQSDEELMMDTEMPDISLLDDAEALIHQLENEDGDFNNNNDDLNEDSDGLASLFERK